MHIVYEETKRMLRGMLPLALAENCSGSKAPALCCRR